MGQINFDFGPTWGIKDEERMKKLLLGVISFLENFEMNLMPICFTIFLKL